MQIGIDVGATKIEYILQESNILYKNRIYYAKINTYIYIFNCIFVFHNLNLFVQLLYRPLHSPHVPMLCILSNNDIL